MGQIQKDKLFPPERGSPAPVFLSFEKVGALDAGSITNKSSLA